MNNRSPQQPHSQQLSSAAILRAIKECRAKPLGDPQRIVVLLTSESVAPPLPFRKALQRRGAVLVEGGTMEKSCLRPLKLLAHRTRLVPTLLVTLENWRAWNRRRPFESAMIRRRTHLVADLSQTESKTN